jgi:hypothetical protein
MARHMLLSSMFSSISKKDMEAKVQQEMVALEVQLGLEREMKEGIVKRPVGRPKKEIVPIQLPTKVNEHHQFKTKTMVRGSYTNWFVPSLWDPIYAAVRMHRSLKGALHYLQLKHNFPGESKSVYGRLSRNTLAEWFTSTGELKEGTKQSNFKETVTYSRGVQHTYALVNHSELELDIITLLKMHRDVGQPLFASTIRGLIRTMIQKRAPSLLDYESKSGFKVSLPWTREFI